MLNSFSPFLISGKVKGDKKEGKNCIIYIAISLFSTTSVVNLSPRYNTNARVW